MKDSELTRLVLMISLPRLCLRIEMKFIASEKKAAGIKKRESEKGEITEM